VCSSDLIKTYYSEKPTTQKLYNENGTLNSDWKEYYNETLPDLYQNGLSIKFNSKTQTEGANWDYLEIYYKLINI
jgi:hypothetical protein